MIVDNILIIPYGWSCLGGFGFQFMDFTGRFINQRQHDIKRKMIFFQQISRQSIHMIGKVTSENSRQMKTFTLFGVCFINALGQSSGNRFQEFRIFGCGCFDKERNFSEIDFTLLTERLHRIEYAIMFRIPFPDTHRKTPGSMYQQRFLSFSGHNIR